MKKILNLTFLIGMLISFKAWADDPNFNSTTRIVTFPRVTIDNNDAYINVELLLSQNGTWEILDMGKKLEPKMDLTGDWTGEVTGLATPYFFAPPPCGTMISEISLVQNGEKVAGNGVVGEGSTLCNQDEPGEITGEVNGSNLLFTIKFSSSGSSLVFNGNISDDFRSVEGEVSWESIDSYKGSWNLTLK